MSDGKVESDSQLFISLVVPVFNEASNIDNVYDLIRECMETNHWRYELIFVNDGSTDASGECLLRLASHNKQVRYITFSRNFGKEAATTAGIHAARGGAVVMIDGDGQFPVDIIPKMVAKWQAGAQVVIGVRKSNRDEGWVKRYGSRLFNWMLNPITGGKSVSGATDFRLIDRLVVNKFNELTERNRVTRGLIDWLGFRREYIPFHANARAGGNAGYDLKKLFKLALHTFVSQSTRPLLFTGALGAFVMFLSFCVGIFLVTEQYVLKDPLHLAITGTAVLAAFLSFLVGVVLVCQGLLALYIESIHSETQNRPLYVISEEK